MGVVELIFDPGKFVCEVVAEFEQRSAFVFVHFDDVRQEVFNRVDLCAASGFANLIELCYELMDFAALL